MNTTPTPRFSKTRFTEFLVRENEFYKLGFEEWVFWPGMLFNAPDKWWGDQSRRDRPHEGLDLCLYKDRWNRILRLDDKTKIPVMYDGVVVRIINDFIGQSVFIEHGLPDDNSRFLTIYGHTNPREGLRVGRMVKAGDIIASLADSSKPKADILPHLHISVGKTSKFVSYKKLDWETIGVADTLKLFDPLDVISVS